MKSTLMLSGCTLALLLSACAREDMASYVIGGDQHHSLSLLRETYPWSSGWDMKLVTTNAPNCLRRHALKEAGEADFKVELFRPEDGVFILHQDGNWYVTEMQKCQLQQYKSPPPAPGELVGSFEEKDGALVFIDASAATTANAASRANRPRPGAAR